MQDYVQLAPIRSEAELRAQADELKALPNFQDCVRRYTGDIAAFREATRPFGKLIANEDRFRVINFVFPLWAQSVASGGTGALTYGTIFEICRRGEVTPRVLKNTLAMAVHLGFLSRQPNPADRRSWLYAPTDLMTLFPHQWLVPAALALDDLIPGQSLTERLRNDPRVLIHFFLSAGREFDSGIQPTKLVPAYMHFCGHREGAPLLAMALLAAEMDGLPYPTRSEVALRFGLTKSQVTNVVTAGVELGFLSLSNGAAHPTEAMRIANSDWVAAALAFLHHHLHSAAQYARAH